MFPSRLSFRSASLSDLVDVCITTCGQRSLLERAARPNYDGRRSRGKRGTSPPPEFGAGGLFPSTRLLALQCRKMCFLPLQQDFYSKSRHASPQNSSQIYADANYSVLSHRHTNIRTSPNRPLMDDRSFPVTAAKARNSLPGNPRDATSPVALTAVNLKPC